jgi:hypothetical protein
MLTISGILDHKEIWLEWLDLRKFMTSPAFDHDHMKLYVYPTSHYTACIFIDVDYNEENEDYNISYGIGAHINGTFELIERVPFGQEYQLLSVFKVIVNDLNEGYLVDYK